MVLLPASTLRAGLPALKNPFNRNGLCPLTEKQFRWRFTNTLSQEESDAIYREHYIPGTNRPFFEAAFANMSSNSPAAVNYSNPARAPLLLICGSEDHISPPSVNKKLLTLQSKAPSPTELKAPKSRMKARRTIQGEPAKPASGGWGCPVPWPAGACAGGAPSSWLEAGS